MDTNPTATQSFLRAEEAAVRLAEELGKLSEESRRYSGASNTLTAAGEQLKTLADAVRGTSERAADVVEAIRGVGAPDILEGLARVHRSADATTAALAQANAALAGLTDAGTEQERRLAVLRATQESDQGAIGTAFSMQGRALEDLLANVRSVSQEIAGNAAAMTSFAGESRLQASGLEAIIGELRTALVEVDARQTGRLKVIQWIAVGAALLAAVAVVVPLWK